MFSPWGFSQSFTESVTSQSQCKRHYSQWHHHLITLDGSRRAAGGEREGWLARLCWRSGGWTLRGVHDYNRALHCSRCSLSLLTLFISFSWWCHFHAEPDFLRTLKRGGGGFLFWETVEWGRREGREVNREQRRQGTSPVCTINSCATGAAVVSAGPIVSIMAVTHYADVTTP